MQPETPRARPAHAERAPEKSSGSMTAARIVSTLARMPAPRCCGGSVSTPSLGEGASHQCRHRPQQKGDGLYVPTAVRVFRQGARWHARRR